MCSQCKEVNVLGWKPARIKIKNDHPVVLLVDLLDAVYAHIYQRSHKFKLFIVEVFVLAEEVKGCPLKREHPRSGLAGSLFYTALQLRHMWPAHVANNILSQIRARYSLVQVHEQVLAVLVDGRDVWARYKLCEPRNVLMMGWRPVTVQLYRALCGCFAFARVRR